MRPPALGCLTLILTLLTLPTSAALTQVSASWVGSNQPSTSIFGQKVQKVQLERKSHNSQGTTSPSAAGLLAQAQQAATLPEGGLSLLYERIRTLDEKADGTDSPSESTEESWVDIPGQRLKAVSYEGKLLDAVWLVTPQAALLHTESGGTVPIPRQQVELLRTHLHSGLLGLALAGQARTRLRHLGEQAWETAGTLDLQGTALQVTTPEGTVWEYLLDPATGRLVADREAESGLIYFYENHTKEGPTANLEVRGLIDSSTGTMLYREEVLERRFNPTLPPNTFEIGTPAKAATKVNP